jgi:4'-phosphopantetheinyl transferase
LHCPPGDICFAENEFGKPFLERTSVERVLEFNLSHAGGLVLVAVCRGRRIGIDIEEIRSSDDISAIAESYFTPRECAFVLGQHRSARERTFLRCWTRKEAYLKGLGKGLSIPLNSFDTLISSGQPVGILESGPGSSDGATWQLADLDLYEGYVAAVAVESAIDRLVHFEWRPDRAER